MRRSEPLLLPGNREPLSCPASRLSPGPVIAFFDGGERVLFACGLVSATLAGGFQPQPRFSWRLVLHSNQFDIHQSRQHCFAVCNSGLLAPARDTRAKTFI